MLSVKGIILLSMARGWGGAEEYLELLSKELESMDIERKILVRQGGEYEKRYGKRGDVFVLPRGFRGIRKLSALWQGRSKETLIHANRYYDIFRGWYLKKSLPGSHLLLYQHCYLNHPHLLPLSLPDGIASISDFVLSSFTKKYPSVKEKSAVIPTGIDLSLFSRAKSSFHGSDGIKIGMVGRFDKNQGELIDSAAILLGKGIDLELHLVGSGKDGEVEALKRRSEKAGIGKSVRFHGQIPHDKIADFYLEMDIIASTMKTEGLSLVAMEAMACGLPFIAYNRAGFGELIDDGETGILVSGGGQEFSKTLESLCQSAKTRERLGMRGMEKARREFGMGKNVERYISFVRTLLR